MRPQRFSDEAVLALAGRKLTTAAIAKELGVSGRAVRKRLAIIRGARTEIVLAPIRRVSLAGSAEGLNTAYAHLDKALAYIERDQGRDDAPPEARAADPPRLTARDRVALRAAIAGRIVDWSGQVLAVEERERERQGVDRFIAEVLAVIEEFPPARAALERRLEAIGFGPWWRR